MLLLLSFIVCFCNIILGVLRVGYKYLLLSIFLLSFIRQLIRHKQKISSCTYIYLKSKKVSCKGKKLFQSNHKSNLNKKYYLQSIKYNHIASVDFDVIYSNISVKRIILDERMNTNNCTIHYFF